MTGKHTPGPWRISYERGTKQIRAANNESLMGDETYYPWVPENPEDWHLIAAAPDLLEALEEAMQYENRDAFYTERHVAPWYEAAAKAVLRARGQE